MSLTLRSGVNPENARTHKLLAAAALANVAVTLKACEYGRENETAEYCRNCSPCGRYPVLQTKEGCVFESDAILRHIARLDRSGGFLYGRTPLEGSQVDMWLDFSATELDAASAPFVHHPFRGERGSLLCHLFSLFLSNRLYGARCGDSRLRALWCGSCAPAERVFFWAVFYAFGHVPTTVLWGKRCCIFGLPWNCVRVLRKSDSVTATGWLTIR
ncbi:elongation factor 1-gamma (EF-1-gamma), putative [Trypanosoma cruzi]|uniref:Elongation factor 1-gamma (EF-1-gamma), putative n=1 Tax=Trypanosoma cruzi (strain CL Brener) TaxID=353153 RepID=Q4E503_TRYCC|nr:elongation factor 1-gamma (EF-1-gamma), putative [Trypanosoma cruzi]EAN99871.1 elongation factor 1-gamma (EF-1-gamma), putative [Trypanosoma cruzi]|eukprot:XP_821722.1 elongation factor 1-gamma (EF-1-gamma) [Trypanosoma cruzi strain CL Brener]